MQTIDLGRRLAAEGLGTAALLATVVGSGIMGEQLAGGNVALALLGNTLATGAILAVLILIFGPVSGGHFNPAVTLSFAMQDSISKADAVAYVVVQVAGGLAGVALAHVMFEAPRFAASANQRSGISQWTAEFVATFGLIATIIGCLRFRPSAVPYAVGLFISAGYWFTSSTSFANPAVTVARTLTDSFSGIRPVDAPGFIAAQIVGAVVVTLFFRWLLKADDATDTVPGGDPPL
jgi:glycerol uptake facilitator-like aquaporin